MIQKALGRIPEVTIRQILHQTRNSIRRLTKLLEQLKELREINESHDLADLLPVAASCLVQI